MSSDTNGHVKSYYRVFGALAAATILTVGLSYATLGHVGNIVVGILIASVKASLVGLFFMHLKYDERLFFLAATFPLVLFAILCFALMPDVGFPTQP